jgi:alpha-tubulin suppressor-like RCC1 family protein
MLAAGVYHSCGLSTSGQVHCWGGNINGQLGDGSRDDRPEPATVESAVDFRSIVAGWNHTCGLDAAGVTYCWGLNDEGQLGDGSRLDRLAPVQIPGSFSALAAGSAHTCGIRGERVLCWGDNAFGQLGDGTRQDRPRPVAVDGIGEAAVGLAAGALHTCVLGESGAVYCWGQNLRGELGDGTTENRSTPGPVAGELTFRSLEAGGGVTCAFATDGFEYCWGQNRSGQLGDGSRTSRAVPTRVVVP